MFSYCDYDGDFPFATLVFRSVLLPLSSCLVEIAGSISQILQLQAHVTLASLGRCQQVGESARSCVRVDQCVSAVRAVDVPIFVCLRSSCNHVTEVGGP
jgi:hypothetical protein